VFALFLLSCLLFACKRMLTYLSYLQQDEYDPTRFLKWIGKRQVFDKKGSFAVLTTAVISVFLPRIASVMGASLLFGLSFAEKDPRRFAKVKLAMTPRAKRIYAFAVLLFSLVQFLIALMQKPLFWILQIILFQTLPLILACSVKVLVADEKKRRQRLIKEAKEILADVSPFVIGITGSYGKTSTKEALAALLNMTLGATFWPEKGVNTEMGITREIRRSLKKQMQFAVIEMAAYGRGSIARLCDLTPPQAGIITNIGVAHLDRFGSQEMIKKTKSELAEAIPKEGILVLNGDNPGTREISGVHRKKRTVLYGFDQSKGDLDCWVREVRFGYPTTEFVLQWRGKPFTVRTSLMGKTALSNLAACFAMSCSLGADPEFVAGAIATLMPVDNRLAVSQENDVTYLHDAYNSNPEGFVDALDVLGSIHAKKRILVTPGMIELESIKARVHETIGRKASQVCDFVIVVGETNRKSLVQGLLSNGLEKEKICEAKNREAAFHALHARLEAGDAVLIENDLPDLYENKVSL